jgi:hypothetical protein
MEELFEVTKHAYDNFLDEVSPVCDYYRHLEDTNIGDPDSFYEEEKEAIRDLWIPVHNKFNAEYRLYRIKKIYFYGCAFSVYRALYEERLETFIKNTSEASEIDFIELELKEEEKPFYDYLLNEKAKREVYIAIQNRIDFLKQRAFEIGFKINENGTRERLPQEPIELLDFSDSNIPTKITYLYELGILEMLQKKNKKGSINKLAELLSGVIGEKATTIQSYINPILAPTDVEQSKSAINNEKIEKVKFVIQELGFS